MPVPENLDYDFWLGPAREAPYTEKRCHFYFRYILDYSGGEMTDRGAHIIDLGQLGNGTDNTLPLSVEGKGTFPKEGLFNTAYVYDFAFEYANGVRLLGDNRGPRGIRFEGDEGWIFIHVHGGNLEAEPQSLLQEVIGPDELHLGRSLGHHYDFIECVKSQGEPKAPVEVGYHSATMCHMANIAMLLGTKLRALFQRRKGRDLFDLWHAHKMGMLNPAEVVAVFHHYMEAEQHHVSQAEFRRNLEAKMQVKAFLSDTPPLLRPGVEYDAGAAFDFVNAEVLSLLEF